MEPRTRYLFGLAVVQLLCSLSVVQSHPDGVNFYKDWLRGKNDEEIERMVEEEQFEAPKLFFYRTPSSFTDLGVGETFSKRTVNKYKNMMLNKDSLDVPLVDDVEQTKEATRFFFPRITPKRSPGAILSWAIPAANRVRVISTNYRPPGINRPAA